MHKTGVLLTNIGTPCSPTPRDVATYLKEFLLDPLVMDIPYLIRQFLVRVMIVPFRKNISAKSYQAIWTEEGSPLLMHSFALQKALQKALGSSFHVTIGMRYQKPNIQSALQELSNEQLSSLIVVPLFPQYASATTGSISEKVLHEIRAFNAMPNVQIIQHFYDEPAFIHSMVEQIKQFSITEYDHILFSFHGLPERQIRKGHEANRNLCYRRASFQTATLLADALNLSQDKYTVCFQSRLGREEWCKPYTNECIQRLAMHHKKLLVVCPSFVADCLETLYEIGIEYAHEFKRLGGERLDFVPSLNAEPTWVEALKTIITKRL